MSELVMEEKRESLCYGMEEETSCGPCEGGKRETLSLERKKRPVVEEEGERKREPWVWKERKDQLWRKDKESFGKEEESDFREIDREMWFFGWRERGRKRDDFGK